jgi:biotin carboxylase
MREVFWCIGGGILQIPIIENVKKLGLGVLVSDGNNECICSSKADIFAHIDIFDIEGHLNYAKSLGLDVNIVGVLAAGIDAPMTMSALCEYLNLPGVPLSISETVHYKSKFREFSVARGIEAPKFQVFKEKDIDELDPYLNEVGTPFIIKNVDSSGSRGTKIFFERDVAEELKIAKEAIKVSKSKSFLVESVWSGQECTVETLFDINGNFHRCFITDRIFDYSNGVPMEIGLVSPSQLPPPQQQACFDLAHEVASKLGITIGAAKFDMIVSEDGPKIIEMTTRLSGGFDCQYLVPASSGKNIILAAIMTACGRTFPAELLVDRKKLTAVTASHWPPSGRINSINGVEKAKKMNGVEQIFFRKHVGEVIEDYNNCTDRVSFVIASGTSLEHANIAAKGALSEIEIEIIND